LSYLNAELNYIDLNEEDKKNTLKL